MALKERAAREERIAVEPRVSGLGQVRLREEWKAVYLNGVRIGTSFFALEAAEPGSRGSYRVRTSTRIVLQPEHMGLLRETVPVLGLLGDASLAGGSETAVWDTPLPLQFTGTSLVARDFGLRSFHMRFDSRLASAEVTGRVRRRSMDVEVKLGDTSLHQKLTFQRRPNLAEVTSLLIMERGLQVGRRYEMRLFDPLSQRSQLMKLRVVSSTTVEWAGRSQTAFRVEKELGSLRTTAWMNEQGETLLEETSLGGWQIELRLMEGEEGREFVIEDRT